MYLQQMKIIHNVRWTPSEIESYRQVAFDNILDGMRELLIAMRDDMHINVVPENVVRHRVR
jgi:guanine nucleotide-binding protein subunit alpha